MKSYKMHEINSETISTLKDKLITYKTVLKVANSFKDVKAEYDELVLAYFKVIQERSDAIDNAYPIQNIVTNKVDNVSVVIELDKDIEQLLEETMNIINNSNEKFFQVR